MIDIHADKLATKEDFLKAFREANEEIGIRLTERDEDKPWGAYYYIDDAQRDEFIERYFGGVDITIPENADLSLKYLVFAPGKRLSWQYHHRRQELWRVIYGPVAVMTSESDVQTEPTQYQEGDLIKLDFGQRHRGIGLASNWGVVAEIWQHMEGENPSNEEDIVRLQDDFGRA